MEKTHAELQREEINLHKQGKFRYAPDTDHVAVDDPRELEKTFEELRQINERPSRNPRTISTSRNTASQSGVVRVGLSKSAYTRIAQKAKRQKINVAEYIEKTFAK